MPERWESTITLSFIYLVILFTLTKKLTRWPWFPSRLWTTHGQALTLLYLHRKCFSVLQLLVLSSCVHLWVRSLPRNSFSEGLKEQRFRKGNYDKYQPGRPKKRKEKKCKILFNIAFIQSLKYIWQTNSWLMVVLGWNTLKAEVLHHSPTSGGYFTHVSPSVDIHIQGYFKQGH